MEFDVTSLHGRRASRRWERTSVGDILERVTWSRPDKLAIVGHDGAYASSAFSRLTYREADQLANRAGNAMLARGVPRGGRVMLFCDNSVEAFLAKLGAAKAGLVCAPLNTMVAPDMAAHLIERMEPSLAIVDDELWAAAEPGFTEAGLRPDVTIALDGEVVPGSVSFEEFIADAPADEPDVEIHGDDIWQVLFTSGTTSMPKAAMQSHITAHFAAYSFAVTLSRGVHHEAETCLGCFLPIIYHVGDQAFGLSPFLCAGTLVIGRRPDPVGLAEAITRERITALWAGSPAMLTGLADTLEAGRTHYNARSLRAALYGWAALPQGTLATLKRHCGEEFCATEILGQTECVSCHRFSTDEFDEVYRRTAPQENYVGRPSPILAAQIVDPLGVPLPDDSPEPGEVVYRSPSMTAGYYRDEEATREAFRGGWFHSGDSCAVGLEGQRVMLDRYKDMIKSGGENVSSLRVEAVLHQHPKIERAAVVGLAHDHWGEAVTAFVVGSGWEEQEVIAFCRARLAGFETPKRVVGIDELPQTVGGKVLKYKLRAAHADIYAASSR
ncbi:MAG TPA: AMP-binding protein [Solirubrobacteraceae bacterium]|jgi:acyl-CoA synthetase (AMP-forming)/AMP-acid ligase II|nr:AMP-binding protein [Solirubrobacteraceae bacterium]